MRNADFWPKLNIEETINTLLDLVSGPIYQPAKPADDLLYSPLFALPRGRSGMGGQVAVPDASCVVVWGRDGYCRTFGTGIHSLRSCPQVDYSADGWICPNAAS
jgi:hypothetical protein